MDLLTFQDFEKSTNKVGFLSRAITNHVLDPMYAMANSANLYDRQLNETIYNYVQLIFTLTGESIEDFTASNNKIASNFFHRLNTQRNTYLLGNGVSFSDNTEERTEDGVKVTVDTTKEFLGPKFDTDLKKAGYFALIHGVTFGFWNVDRLYVFKYCLILCNPWTVAHQTLLSMEFSRQKYWSGLPLPPPGTNIVTKT